MKLTQNYSLTIQPQQKNLRLVIFDNGIEVVCRKERLTNLSRFIAIEEGRIFKGRLQLYKHQDMISIEVKGNPIATITANQLISLIDSAFKQ